MAGSTVHDQVREIAKPTAAPVLVSLLVILVISASYYPWKNPSMAQMTSTIQEQIVHVVLATAVGVGAVSLFDLVDHHHPVKIKPQ